MFKSLIFEEMSRIGAALGDPLRLKVLELIVQAPKPVELVAKQLGVSQASTSHHLRLLRDAKIAVARRDGRFVYYEATAAGVGLWACLLEIAGETSARIREAVRDFFHDPTFARLTYPELKRMLEANTIVLLDVRPPEEFAAGHFPGAMSIPLPELEKRMRELPSDREIVAYCRGKYCLISHSAAALLRKRGLRASRLPEGIAEWKGEHHRLERRIAHDN